MPLLLSDLFATDALDLCIQEGLVSRRKHPSRQLCILNYTARCQYEPGLWNEVTRQCRGLIYDAGTLAVVARPFPKFFNYGQDGAPTIPLDAPVWVTDKIDGSLGIYYGNAIATRGSFDGDQAVHATTLWRTRYTGVCVPSHLTPLFEIVYPENRIVLDYRETDDLILLGAMEVSTGRSLPPHDTALHFWPGPRASVFSCRTLADALAMLPRENAEGIVVHDPTTEQRVKIKQEDYVALHRIVTGLSERSVWEHVSAGKPVSELLAVLPDEFHGWVTGVAARLVATVERSAAKIESAYSTILSTLPPDATRKDFARLASQTDLASYLFARHDGKDLAPRLWKDCYPAGRVGPRGDLAEMDVG